MHPRNVRPRSYNESLFRRMFNKVRKMFMVYYDIQNTDSHSPNYTHTQAQRDRKREGKQM